MERLIWACIELWLQVSVLNRPGEQRARQQTENLQQNVGDEQSPHHLTYYPYRDFDCNFYILLSNSRHKPHTDTAPPDDHP